LPDLVARFGGGTGIGAGTGQLYSLSYHAYSLHGGNKALLPPVWHEPSNNSSAAYHTRALLSSQASAGFAEKYRKPAAEAAGGRLQLVIGEGNSESGGGRKGTSDTFAAALWCLDWLPSASKVGLYPIVAQSFCTRFPIILIQKLFF
jgi:hypothetical protein